MNIERLWSLEAETAVLGSMLIKPATIDLVLGHVADSEAFFAKRHQLIFDGIMLIYLDKHVWEGDAIDAVTLRTKLKEKGWLFQIGEEISPQSESKELEAVRYLARILESVPSAANAEYYAMIVAEKWEYRKLVHMTDQIQKTLQENISVEQMGYRIQNRVLEASQTKMIESDRLQANEGASAIINQDASVIPTGYYALDQKVVFSPGDVVIIAGRPSMGKSSLAVNMVDQMKVPSLIISLETPGLMVSQRMIARRARVNRRYVTEIDYPEIKRAADEIKELPIWVADHCDNLSALLSLVRRMKKAHQIEVVVVDYLQLLTTSRRNESRNQEVSEISRSLKQIAVRENVLLIDVCQLSRKVEDRNDRRPRLSDLRDSGSLEQDADWVLLLYRADYYRKPNEEKDGRAEVIIAKARDGETGVVDLVFLPEYTSFENLARGPI